MLIANYFLKSFSSEAIILLKIETYSIAPFGLISGVLMLFAMGFMKMMVSTRFGLRLLENHPRLFSMGAVSKEGPSLETAKNTNFEITLVGKGWKTKGRITYDIRKILDPSFSL